jgi:FKBP-type peptidyl-prolyl cis-trans isomerase
VLDAAFRLLGNPNVSVYDGSYDEYSKKQLVDNPPVKLSIEVDGEGEGKLCPQGSRVLVHYTGRLADGTKFDSSYDRGKPLDFIVGVGQVIKGWDEGIVQLKKGQKAIITCPPEYAYGARGVPGVIPPNSTLVFEVELVDFIRQK